jgi:hypothetical protein
MTPPITETCVVLAPVLNLEHFNNNKKRNISRFCAPSPRHLSLSAPPSGRVLAHALFLNALALPHVSC